MTEPKETQAAVRLVVHGRVQGVGFRYFTRDAARKLDVVGWVKNLWNGTVEIWAEGPKFKLESLIQSVQRGPSAAYVRRVDKDWRTPQGKFNSFQVRY